MRRRFQLFGLGISFLSAGSLAAVTGKVFMQGSILETPCAIAMESLDQTIDIGTIPISVLKQWGQGPRHPFTIHVIDCRLSSTQGDIWQTFTVTFEGMADQYGFNVFGSASGVSLTLDDEHGDAIIPGTPRATGPFLQGNRELRYGLRLISNHSTYKPGVFQSIIRFKLDYF